MGARPAAVAALPSAARINARRPIGSAAKQVRQLGRCSLLASSGKASFAKQSGGQRGDRIRPLRGADQAAAPQRNAGYRAGSGDRWQQPGAQQRGFARAAHSVDQQERLAVGGQLLQPLGAGGDGACPAEEQVSVIEVEDVETAERRLDLLLRRKRHTIGAHRPRDVLHLVLAKVQEIEREPIANLRMDRFGDAYSARR